MDHGSEIRKDEKSYSNSEKKRKSGRPKNSKNKPKIEEDFSPEDRELESLVQEIIINPESEKRSLRQRSKNRVSVQGVKSLGDHFACLCRGVDFFKVKRNINIFQKKREILLIIFIAKSLQKEQNSTNLLL